MKIGDKVIIVWNGSPDNDGDPVKEYDVVKEDSDYYLVRKYKGGHRYAYRCSYCKSLEELEIQLISEKKIGSILEYTIVPIESKMEEVKMEDLFMLAQIDNTGNMTFMRSGKHYTIAVYDSFSVAKGQQTRVNKSAKRRKALPYEIVRVKDMEVLPNV